MNLLEEFRSIVVELEGARIPYAICGGMAMAAYGHARATQDIEVLIAASSVDTALETLGRLGYKEASRLTLGAGQVRMVRAMKAVGEDHLIVDILEAPDAGDEAWADRRQIETDFGKVWFASKEGLIAMKQRSGRLQDLADIERLKEGPA
jgi:hypothetical protein